MKKIVPLLILAFVTLKNFAQQEDSLLKNFKFRIDHYRAVNLDLNTASQYNKVVLGLGTQKQTTSSSSFYGTYYTMRSTDNIQFMATANLGTGFNFSKSDYTSNIAKGNSFYADPGVSVLNRWFSKNIFTELGANVSSSLGSGKQTQTGYPLPHKASNTDYYLSLNIGIGKGRLENITDMQNALWLYKELLSTNTLARKLTNEEQTQLGRSITRGNNTRVLDARRRTKFVLSTVDNFLQQNNLINKTDINYFNSLNDILFFAFNNPRYSGTEKFIRLTPQLKRFNNIDNDKNIDTKNEQTSNNKSVLLSLGFKKYKPVSLLQQNNYGAAANFYYYDLGFTNHTTVGGISTNDIKSSSVAKQAAVNLYFEHAIYPNTRTVVSFKLETETGYQEVAKETNFFGTAYLDGTMNYFINYQTRFICNIGVAYQKNKYQFDRYTSLFPNNIRLYASAGLNISL